MQEWRVYMDCCCFNRPYDDLSDTMVRLESEAIMSIIDRCEQQELIIYGSDALLDEMDRITDKIKYEKVLSLYLASTSNTIELNEEITRRASELIAQRVKPFDALHVASAEHEEVDVFLTTDKRLLNAAKRISFGVKCYNPAVWLLEVLQNEL